MGYLVAGYAEAKPLYKIQLDPTMSLAGYANIQIDRPLAANLSAGMMGWHRAETNGLFAQPQSLTSLGVRLDWFDRGVFESGWHTNAMIKVDLVDAEYARVRYKVTQSYQRVRSDFYLNLGIGFQAIQAGNGVAQEDSGDYSAWLLPAWEFSIGRAF